MSTRDQPTPPFNSPYQQAMKSNSLLHSPAYPSPARSDCEPSKYPTEGLGLYAYSHSFPVSGPTTSSILYPPSPQPTEAWTHLSTGTSPLMTEAHVDPWATGAFDHPVSRSPLPWEPQHASHRSSLSSRDLSIFSREGSEHAFPNIKLEGAHPEWTPATGGSSPPELRHAPLTVAPERLTNGIFPYDNAYASPPMAKYESGPGSCYDHRDYESASYDRSSRSPRLRDGSVGITARTRLRRNPTTADNAQFSCHVCGKLFQRSYNHKTHLETHNPTRKKEHICPHEACDRQFVRKTDLDRHQNSVHRKLKVFKCTKCDAHFARKDTLRRHEEDGCPRRNELPTPNVLSHSRSMRTGPGAVMPYYHSPRPDMYDTRSPPMFRDGSFNGSPSGF
ncbi:hypothetical protein BDV95DRAFT_489612 [Massariosphaeria phaeospora]|uniref:C2H2-type domain-containing protein n=1 Tax=Massariosphaeria phaeospora TaxID=100035 RepID=A0A7C8MCU2_9PLEO|nr:hypothetical protein BDV95DRAFT_489612 [Massariosphaeria phaeospora]